MGSVDREGAPASPSIIASAVVAGRDTTAGESTSLGTQVPFTQVAVSMHPASNPSALHSTNLPCALVKLLRLSPTLQYPWSPQRQPAAATHAAGADGSSLLQPQPVREGTAKNAQANRN